MYDPRTHNFILTSAEDNLMKGASGQAVQIMNLWCGFEETAGWCERHALHWSSILIVRPRVEPTSVAMLSMKMLLVLIGCALLTACNSVDHQAADAIISRGAASIQGSVVKSDMSMYGPKKTMFWVTQIDGEPVKERGYFRIYELHPGRRVVGVGGGSVHGEFAGTKSLGGESAVIFTAEAGHQYEIRGAVSGTTISLFIFDLKAGAAVSDTAAVQGHSEERKLPVLILVPIP